MTWLKRTWFFLLAALFPLFFSDDYLIGIMISFGIFAILASSLNLVIGYLGELSFGHAAFFGVGAYASAILTENAGFPFAISIIFSILISGVVGAIVAFLALRLKGAYFAIVTLAFGEILRLIALNWVDLTKGPMGYTGIPRAEWFGIQVSSSTSYYYMVLIFLGISVYFVHSLISSKSGMAFIAIREKADLAKSIGVNVFNTKLLAFILSTMLAGLAGVLYAHFYQILTPDNLGLHYTTTALIMVIVGGRGTLYGPIVGALIFTLIPETLRMAGELRIIIFALLLGLSSVFMPEGITNAVMRLAKRMRMKRAAVVNSVNTEG